MRFIRDKERRKMVRVISCHHFQAQDVFSVDNEPVALATAADLLLVATLQHCIEVWDLKSPGKILHSFPTVDQAKQMVYCNKGDYVATLEVRSSRQAVMSFVRMYINWQVDMKGQPMRARIAGRVTPSSQSGVGLLEMVELPLKKQAFCIASCYETGNLAVGLGDVVGIFQFCIKTHDISRRSFCDLEHLLDITFTLSAHHLALCEDVLACLSPNELHVVKINILPTNEQTLQQDLPVATPEASDSEMESYPLSIPLDAEQLVFKDENFIFWDINAADQELSQNPSQSKWSEHAKWKLHSDSWPLVLRLPGLGEPAKDMHTVEVREILGPSEACNVKTEAIWMRDYPTKTVTLLYRHFLLDQEISSGLHSLHLLPVFAAGTSQSYPMSDESKFLFSKHSGKRCGLSCFFSSPQQGFLYDISEKAQLLATYPYTSSARAVTLEMNLLHAVTEAGLETYTLKNFLRVSHTPPPNHKPMMLPTFPDDPVCLVGLQAFLNIEQIVLSQSRLVLLSAAADELSSSQDSDTSNWTIYSLRRSTPIEFYHDMLEVAEANREKSPSTYIHLLLEAHCVLKGNIITYSDPDPTLMKLYQESCCLMGDYYLMSEASEENRLAVGYYQLSQCSIEDVVSRVLNLWAQVHPMPLPVKGLIDYLNHHLLDGNIRAGINQAMADTILDLYADNEPLKLAQVITRGLNTYSREKALLLLKKRILTKKGTPEEIVALAWLYIEIKQTEQLPQLLSSLPKERLRDTLVHQYWLWLDGNQFSALAQTIRHWRPDIFVEVSLQLVFDESYLISKILLMFQEASEVPLHKILHFKEFLEALLTSNKMILLDSEASVLLAKIYLLRMMERSKEKQSQSLLRALNLFGVRPAWINLLPPFEGRSVRDPCTMKQGNQDKDQICPCWECNEDLLRLQSLLSHESCPVKLKTTVLQEVLKSDANCPGSLSLQVLSVSSYKDVIPLLADNYPLALIQHAKDTFADNLDKWQMVRDALITRLKKTAPATPQCNVLNQAVQLLLSQMAEIFSPATFLSLLPPGDPATFFPYMKRCCHKHQAQALREKIITKGKELKAVV